ncbi:Ig-like domain-containing protein [Haloarcula montana]|uniref:Ig-like domain-containing protein n=1 Tax=Haloarcula montana TaxID=3111776 RepID=UPI002D79EB33|nr:Ig-like domain-containing protein [Haloarcula sp. GH36]
MEFLGEERAQSVQVGAVLLFGILIIAFSTYQAFVVPDQNREVEFNHNQEVQQQLQDLRNSIVSVPGTSSTEAVSVQLGTRYPSRLLALNPGPSSGTLRTDGTETDDINVTIDNASASGETGDYWTGTQPRRYNTGTVVYSPNYNLYDAPDTFYENSVAFNQFRTGNITLSEQTVVNGRSISLVALNGTLSRSSSGSTTVDVRPVSHSERTITVTNDSATTNVSVSFLTRIPESTWETELLAEEIDSTPGSGDDDRYVADVSSTDGPGPYRQLTITFERGVDYQLQLAKAGVGVGATDTSAAYMTNISGNGAQVTRGESTELVLEVRDSYNNPVRGTAVSASVRGTNNGVIEPVQPVSDSDGRVRFRYQSFPANDTGTHRINVSYVGLDDTFDAETPENVSMSVEVKSGNSNPSNPSPVTGDYALITAVQPNPDTLPDDQGEIIRLDISNTDTSGWRLRNDNGVTLATLNNIDETVYFARNPGEVEDLWGLSDVQNFNSDLANGGDNITLEDDTNTVVDYFAYEGRTFSDGTSFNFQNGSGTDDTERQVAVRKKVDGDWVDSNSASDWSEQHDCAFFDCFDRLEINDVTDASKSNPKAEYDFDYFAAHPSANDEFGEVEVTLIGESKTSTFDQPRQDDITLSGKGGSGGEQFTIRVRIYTDSGYELECLELTDTADGSGSFTKSDMTRCLP